MTPEGKIKRKVSDLLRSYTDLYYFMPVPAGYGESTLDYIGCYKGRFFSIETKSPKKKPTDRQLTIIGRMMAAGAAVFVISDEAHLVILKDWLDTTT